MPGILKQKGSVAASCSNWEIICPTWLLPSLLQFCKHEITLKKNKKIHLHFYVIFMNFIIKNMELFKRWRAAFWNAKFSRDSLVYKNHLSHMRRIEVRTFIWIGTELDTAAPLDTQHLLSCATSFHPWLTSYSRRAPSALSSHRLQWKWGYLALCRNLPLINSLCPLWIEGGKKTPTSLQSATTI